MDINDILKYDKVFIQCHDNPDADALACAFAISTFLKERGKASEIIYSGYAPISKANLKLMIDELDIETRYIPKTAAADILNAQCTTHNAQLNACHGDTVPDPECRETCPHDLAAVRQRSQFLLLIVDGQYGAGNVKKFDAANVAVIDHHIQETPVQETQSSAQGTLLPVRQHDIRPFLGSCSTLVWLLLKNAGFDFSKHADVSTALYYGLYTDTGELSEIIHPLDMDARDSLRFNAALTRKLKNCNIAAGDLTLAGKSLLNGRLHPETHSAVFFAEPCDPNILGFISDLALQAETIDTCVVFCEINGGVKLSVRSCVKEVMANELAQRLCEGGGSGGGHSGKAGGFISGGFIGQSGLTALDFLTARYRNYFGEYDHYFAGKYKPDIREFETFVKLKIPVGYVRTEDIYPAGTEMIVRTLEGDSHIVSDKDTYIMVGIRQEVYPIKREKFEKSYERLYGAYSPRADLLPEKHYPPNVKNRREGVSENIEKYIRPCVSKGETEIYAKQLTKRAKVFTAWNPESYMYGAPGDWLALRKDDMNDVYIIENSIFFATYGKK